MISIIVPVYNSEKTLKRCIESLIGQTYSDIEILLVIDGPTDSSEEIGKSFEKTDSRVKVIMKDNEGVSAARNTGLEHAKGEYIQFVDSDDYIAPNMCEKLLGIVDKSGVELVLCGFHHLFVNRDIVKVPKAGTYQLKDKPEVFLDLYEAGFLNMPWNKLFKKELIHNKFDSTISLGEDLLFNLDYMKKIEKLAIIDEPLYYYIQQKGQDTLSSKKRKDKYDIAIKICETAKESFNFIIKDYSKEKQEALKIAGDQVIYKRLILEFLDEIEGMAYDKTLTRKQKLETIDKYMKDAYICKVNKAIGNIQIDYQIINFFLRWKFKYIVYILIYIRKWCLNLLEKIR
jgi:glycosyltransferase involved in cell wall biosynthesis